MRRIAVFFVGFVVQPVAFYMQIYDIAKHDVFRYVLYVLGALLLVWGIWLYRKGGEQRKASWMSMLEGGMLALVAFVAGIFVEQETRMKEYLENVNPKVNYASWSSIRLYEAAKERYDTLDFFGAMDLARMASEKGSADAFDLLGVMYAQGYGCEKDYERAAYHFSQGGRLGSSSLPRMLKIFPELKNSGNSVVRETIEETLDIISKLDSLSSCVRVFAERGGENAVVEFWTKNYAMLEAWSRKGFFAATAMLYTRAIILDDEDECAKYAGRLSEERKIPDLPNQRYYFFRYLESGLPGLEGAFSIDELNTLIDNNDFYLTLADHDGVAYGRMRDGIDVVDKYRYNKAQYERCVFLKTSPGCLVTIYSGGEDLDTYYDFSRFCLNRSVEIIEQVKEKNYPPVFVN